MNVTSPPGASQSVNWDAVVTSIADEEAILVLGPDAIPLYHTLARVGDASMRETTFSQLTRDRIRQAQGIDVEYYYERDNLFLFKDQRDKNAARKVVRDVARDSEWLPDEELLRQIIAMPFAVILNLSPDQHVYQAFIRHFQAPQFDFCTPYNKDVVRPVNIPTRNNPLLYNLCGNVLEKLDSPILDYFDLFQLFTKLLGNDEQIPQELKNRLRDADTFILLGFQLDRWYFQLFLQYLNWLDKNAFTNVKQNFPILSKLSDDNREFILNQFNITHLAPSRVDFDALFDTCVRRKVVRTLHDPASPVEIQVRTLAVKGAILEAIDLLEAHVDALKQKVDLPLLRSRYNDWLRNRNDQLADARDLGTELNRIRYTLLTYAQQLNT